MIRFLPGETEVEAVARDLQDSDEALLQLKYNLAKAQEQMKRYTEKGRRMQTFNIGDCVFLKLHPHRQQSVVRRMNPKLPLRFYGPFSGAGEIR